MQSEDKQINPLGDTHREMQQNEETGVLILLLILLSVVAWIVQRIRGILRERNERITMSERLYLENKRFRDDISNIINDNLTFLKEDRALGTRYDRYGIPDDKAWKAKCEYFVDKVIPYKLTNYDADKYDLMKEDIYRD